MYQSSVAISRPEITAFLEESKDLEKQFIASQILPSVEQEARAGRYPKLQRKDGQLMNKGSTARGPLGSYNRTDRAHGWDTYDCKDRGHEEVIDDVDVKELQRFTSLETLKAKLAKRYVMMDYEIRVADLVMSSANSGITATAAAVAYTEANIATFDFARDLQDAITRLEKKAVIPNTLVIARDLWNRIQRSTKLQSFLYSSLGSGNTKLITTDDVSKVFSGLKIVVPGIHYNSGDLGQDVSFSPIWTTATMLLADIQSGDFDAGGLGRTITWSADCPGGLFSTETYRDEKHRADVIRVRMHSDEKIVDAGAAELITTSYA